MNQKRRCDGRSRDERNERIRDLKSPLLALGEERKHDLRNASSL